MGKSIRTSGSLLLELRKRVEQQGQQFRDNYAAFVAFDGFIDTLQKVISRVDDNQVIYFNTIRDFADHLHQMDGKSGQVEWITNKVKMGGNAPIMASALGQLGIKTTCLGSMGFPEIDPLFKKNVNTSVNLVSATVPGKSTAIEFDNGKIILSDLSMFKTYDWNYIKAHVGLPTIKKFIESSKLVALVDWANLNEATSLWRGLLEDIIKLEGKKDRLYLFDLCDPSKKSSTQIKEALDLISQYSDYGSVTLGLNENEANKIWLALRNHPKDETEKIKIPDLRTTGYSIYSAMNIDTLLIHPLDRTLVFKNQKKLGKQSIVELKGHLVTEPKIQTGAGDNLNAGFSFGLMAGFEIEYCMLLGMATAGAYVQNGISPDVSSIINYIDSWIASLEKVAKVEAV